MTTITEWRPIPGYAGYECCRSARRGQVVRNQFGYVLTPLRGEHKGCFRLVGPWGVAIRPGRELVALAFPEEATRECATCGASFAPRVHNQVNCPECSRHFLEERHTGYSKRTGNSRRCHDCGKPTTDYRCSDCWAKLRGRGAYYHDHDMEGI